MNIIVNDANILIDLLKLDLIEPFFQMVHEYFVTDLVLNEIQEDNVHVLKKYIRTGRLTQKTFDFQALSQIQLLKTDHPALSIPDCSCLYLSERLSAILLTGDAHLRKMAKRGNVPVHGLIWVFDQLVDSHLILPKTASEKLKCILSMNSRLPAAECAKRISKWQTGK